MKRQLPIFAVRAMNSSKTEKLDWINLMLMGLSLLVAIYLPFKLFLFSYAVLGPLHYLTEINWLKEKQFFLKGKVKWLWPLLFISASISLYPIFKLLNWDFELSTHWMKEIAYNSGFLILLAFLFASMLVFVKSNRNRFYAIPVIIALSLAFKFVIPNQLVVLGAFLPTLFHVYLFTLLFVLFGAKKSGSKPGFINAIALALVPFLIAVLDLNPESYQISEELSSTFNKSNMASISQYLASWLALEDKQDFSIYSSMGFKIQIFIAFAYTYHYLNWFSKTSVIGWKSSLTKVRSKWIGLLWILAVLLYYYDYQTGFIALFFLSYLHVMLEFPLNVISAKGLFGN